MNGDFLPRGACILRRPAARGGCCSGGVRDPGRLVFAGCPCHCHVYAHDIKLFCRASVLIGTCNSSMSYVSAGGNLASLPARRLMTDIAITLFPMKFVTFVSFVSLVSLVSLCPLAYKKDQQAKQAAERLPGARCVLGGLDDNAEVERQPDKEQA